MCTAFFISLSL